MLYALLHDRTQFDVLYQTVRCTSPGLRGGAALGTAGDGDPAPGHLRRGAGWSKIEKGADIALHDRRANRDHRKYSEPDRYDMFRSASTWASVSRVHVCLGMHLAPAWSHGWLSTSAVRPAGALHAGPGGGCANIEGMAFRSPLSPPVVFEAP